jgi:hypothetical protein
MLADSYKDEKLGIDNPPLDVNPAWHPKKVKETIDGKPYGIEQAFHGNFAREAKSKVRYVTSGQLLRELKPGAGPADPQGSRRSGFNPRRGLG